MARPTKQGIDFFSVDTEFDDDLQLFVAETGAEGIGILITIWQAIYKSNGYYIKYDDKFPLKIKQRCFSNVENIVNVVENAIKFEIFNVELFEKYKILTSRGIQKRYFSAARLKKQIEIIPEFCLVDVSGVKNGVNVVKNGVNAVGNATKEEEEEEVKEEVNNSPIIPPGDDDTPPEKKEKIFPPDSVEYRLSEKLKDLIHNRDPSAKKPNLQKWAKDIDLLHRRDNRSFETIEDVIEWCQGDSFWQDVILDTKKLRAKFQQLYLKMKNNGNGKKPAKGVWISDHSGKIYEGTPPEDIPWLPKEDDAPLQ